MNTAVDTGWRALGDCPRGALRWAALAYRLGVEDGRQQLLAAIGQAGVDVARAAQPVLRQRRHEDIFRSRQIDHAPCPTRCGSCSRCIASRAYWSRGGRPYLGAAREAQLARGGAA